MSTQAHYFRVGVFVLSAIALAVVGVIVFGSLSLGQGSRVAAETTFQQSVQGLSVGSQVLMRGVRVGTVTEIGFVHDLYDLDPAVADQYGTWVVVRIAFESSLHGGRSARELREWLDRSVARGLRLRLASQGLTGGKFVEADFLDPARFPAPELPWQPRSYYVPSAPGVFTEIVSAVDKFTQQMERMDLAGITEELKAILQNIRRTTEEDRMSQMFERIDGILTDLKRRLESPEVTATLANLQDTSESARSLLAKLDAGVDEDSVQEAFAGLKDSLETLDAAAAGLPEVIAGLEETLDRVQWLLSSDQPDIEKTLVELRKIMENLRVLTDTARQYPSLLLFGEAPRPLPGEGGGKR